MAILWNGWGGILGVGIYSVFFTIHDIIGLWLTGNKSFWWSGVFAALLTAPIIWKVVRKIRRTMTEEQKIGDYALMNHHFMFIPLAAHPYLYFFGGIVGLISNLV